MKADMITGAMVAEESLARKESGWREEAVEKLPEELKKEVERQKAVIGDLAGLPPGHPLLTAMEEARLRYEEEQRLLQDSKTETDLVQVRRAKRLESKKVQQRKRVQKEDEGIRLRRAVQSHNASIAETVDAIRRLRKNVSASQEEFDTDRYAMMKLNRLDRMLVAVERGLVESRINEGRVTNA
jgi:hypothetical protein